MSKQKESFLSLLPYQGRIELRKSGLKITGESIVKEFRRQERQKSASTFQPYRAIPQSHPSFVRRIFDRINWQILFEITCWGLVITAIAMIAGLIVFGPFTVKEFWR